MPVSFNNYAECRQALTVRCGIRHTPEYVRDRITALQNPADRSTAEFIDCYGEAYLRQVITWFEKAAKEGR